MSVEVREVSSRSELKQYIYLPAKIHSREENFLPPIYMDEWNFYNPKKNHAFKQCDTILALAWKDKKVVGRIMGIIHHTYNQVHNENSARFEFFDCYNDPEVSHALIAYIEQWGRNHEVDRMVGPFGFSDKDPEGFLVEGYEYLPLIASACNPPYMVELLEAEGYTKEMDCLMFRFPIAQELPPLYHRINQRFHQKGEFRLVEFLNKRQLKPYIIPVLRLMNETYDELFGYVTLSDTEIMELADRYLPVIDARFVKIIMKDDQVVAFVVGIPNFSVGIKKSGGRLFPFGIIHIIRASAKSKQMDMMLGAVKRNFQGTGLEIVAGMSLLNSAKAAGMDHLEFHSILENNRPMVAEMERVNLKPHKRFRVFHKEL